MAKGIAFATKPEANEYIKAMKERGWNTLLQHETTKVGDKVQVTWTVHVSEVKEGKRMPSGKIPESIAEIMEQEEAEIGREWPKRQVQRLKRGTVITGKGIVRTADEAALATARGETIKPVLEHTSKRMDVVAGMKRSIPVVGGSRHGYFAKIGETGPARITEQYVGRQTPRITGTPDPRIRTSGDMPLIAGTGLGVPPDARFQTTPGDMRFQVPRMRKLRVGHEAFPESEEEEEKSKE